MPETTVTVVAELTAIQAKEEALGSALRALLEPTHKEEGSIMYDLYRSTDQSGLYIIFAKWASQEALDKHLASPHIAEFRKVSEDLMSKPAKIVTYKKIE